MEQVKVIGGIKVKDSDGNVMNPASEEAVDAVAQLIALLVKKTPVYSQDEKGNIRVLPQGGYTKAYAGFDGAYDDSMYVHYHSYSRTQANIQRNLMS